MNVLHINQSDISGGAAIAGYRLHQGLITQNIESRLLVGSVKTSDDRIAQTPLRNKRERILSRITRVLGLNYLDRISTFDIRKHSFYQNADLLNFHNLHTGYFNYLAIPQLTQPKPAVFTLHDMWSFTGHCAYSYDCDRWTIGCGQCPYPNEYPTVRRDSTRIEWKLKNWVYHRSHLTIVTPSQWLTERAKQSLLARFPIHHIPYGIDTDAYAPLNTEKCRLILGIDNHKKVLLFSADSLKDKRKGGDLLLKALIGLPQSLKNKIVLLTLGYGGETLSKNLGIESLHLGYVSSDRLKSIAYSAADLFVCPTRADNLPLVLQESLACGTPIVSFDVGGVSDLVRPNMTGYLAKSEDFQDLSYGILKLFEEDERRYKMGQVCREIALREYSLELQAKRYIELYQQILKKENTQVVGVRPAQS
ncbi:MAG: glycosyltransferase family 4 protein [Cyanobacteriota bacterium]|nr:glycosyltransferase family 4 protein [Cyanobacteriota bacterium]